MFTAILAKVVAYDQTRQSADVRAIAKVDGFALPILRGLPVRFPRGTGAGGKDWSLTGPLAAGDPVTVHVLTLPVDEYLETGADEIESKRSSARWRFDLSNSFCVPGPSPFSGPLPGDAVDSTSPVLRGDPVLLGDASASDFVALAAAVLSELQSIKTAFDLHIHTGVTTGPGSSGPPATPLPAPSSVAATKVKAT